MLNSEKIIIEVVRKAISLAGSEKGSHVFDALQQCFLEYWNRPCSSMLELRKRTTKEKGHLFEVFCKMYLQQKGYTVWLLGECPEDILSSLGLASHDVGIDLIARTTSKDGKQTLWFPIQCKFRAESKTNSHTLSWKTVSTFLSLCSRTGPNICEASAKGSERSKIRGWAKHIIMTNCKSVRWQGRKTKLDWTIAETSFKKPNNIFWSNFIKKVEDKSQISPCSVSDTEKSKTVDVKTLRQAWLDKLTK